MYTGLVTEKSFKVKVLHLVKTSEGAPFAVRQMRELVNLGVEVHVALPAGGRFIALYEAAGVHIHPAQLDFPVRKPWYLPDRFRTLRRLVKEVQPDIIHSHFVGTTLTMRLALGPKHPTPRFFQVAGPLHLENPLVRRVEMASASTPDRWIGSCQRTCDYYRAAGFQENRIFLSYYGTDIEKFSSTRTGKFRQALNLDMDTTLVGMVAYIYAPKRFIGQKRGLKGHEDLIDALKLCLAKGVRLKGVFVGGPWDGSERYEAQVRAYAQAQCSDDAVFLGHRNDVGELYPDLDIAVHPSLSESVGGAVESLLARVPTIATNVGGFPDLVVDGQTGWLVPPRCPEQIAAAILRYIDDPDTAKALAANGQRRAEYLFDVRRTAKEILEIYKTVKI
ncbi:MAG TPA: glycosyltransferase family 4 protein [Aggregatilineaceae bacterium]|nr:glycosyltransferase family 4 protein [Aggregatilineaceae bacterium]